MKRKIMVRVLLVDDEKDFTDALAERLETRGLYVAAAQNGEEALARLGEEEFDVIVLDMQMPGKDGIETLQEIKQVAPLSEVILLTGYGTLDSATRALGLGAYYYLTKPSELNKLLEYIVYAYKQKAEHEERIRQGEIKRLLHYVKADEER